MALPTFYATGSASVNNGATTITFVGALLGTEALPTFRAGDLFHDPAQPLVPGQRLASVDYVAGTAELWVGWPGTSMTADPYEVRFVDDGVRSTAQTRKLLEQLSVVQANGRGLFYRFGAATADTDPGNGYLRFNHASIESSTGGFLDNLDANGAAVSAELDTWDASTSTVRGKLWVRKIAAPSVFHALSITGSVVDGTGYRKLAWTYVGGSGAFAADDELMVFFAPNGDKGEDGVDGTDGVGLPPGGTIGQVAKKASNADYAIVWADETGGGGSVESVVAGDNIAVDNTDAANPVVTGLQWPELLRSTNRMPRGSFIRGVDGWGANFNTEGAIAIFGFDPTSVQPSNLVAYFNRSKVQLGCNVTAKVVNIGSPRPLPVDVTKKHRVTVAAMGYGPVDPLPSTIQVHCYNSSGQFISTLTVNINVVLSPTLPNGYYHAVINELGGSAPAFPAGTVSAVPQFGFTSTASQGLQVYMMAMIAEDELPSSIGAAIANAGGGTHEAASDGTHLYIISHGTNEIAKMNGDLKKVATLAIGDYPHDIVVVGTDLWVCNHDAANIQRIPLSTFTVANTYAITGAKNGFGLGTDGTRLWLAAGTNAQGCALYEVNVGTGALTLLSTDLNTGAANLPIRYLAGSLWTIHEGNSQVKRINPTGGATLATINCNIGEIYGLGSGNGYVFACGSDGVAVVAPATNSIIQTHRYRALNRGMSNVEVSGRYAFACAANGVMVIDVGRNKSREIVLDGGSCKWARALPDGRVVIGAYAAPWMFVLG